MCQEIKVRLRKFERSDIPNKVEWINNPENNKFLHYDIPLSIKKTEKWFDSHIGETGRYDAVIEVDGVSVGIIGLLNIDKKNSKAEYYITIGKKEYKGKSVGEKASLQIIQYGFKTLGLNRIYLFTETENFSAQKLFEKIGFTKEGIIRNDIFSNGRFVDRFAYGLLREDWKQCK